MLPCPAAAVNEHDSAAIAKARRKKPPFKGTRSEALIVTSCQEAFHLAATSFARCGSICTCCRTKLLSMVSIQAASEPAAESRKAMCLPRGVIPWVAVQRTFSAFSVAASSSPVGLN